jgi:hypothetical protein
MQSAGTQYDSILLFGAPVLIVLAQCSEAIGPCQNALTLRIRRHSSLHGSRHRPPNLFGLPPRPVRLVSR